MFRGPVQEDVVYTLSGHTDTVTYLALSPDGTHLLSNSMDSTLRAWDVRPFVAGSRGVRVRCLQHLSLGCGALCSRAVGVWTRRHVFPLSLLAVSGAGLSRRKARRREAVVGLRVVL